MSEKRMFEFVEGTSSKFWEIWRDGAEVSTRYGRIGTEGQMTLKTEADDAKAQKLYEKLIKEKTGKGYVEKEGAPSKQEAPTKKAPAAKKQPALHPWMATGLGYRTADFDADDVYVFRCSLDGKGNLAITFDGTAGEGAFVCAAAALDQGVEKIHIAQGGVMLSQTTKSVDETTPADAFPPFLLSRSSFTALKAGKPIAWPTVLSGDGKTVDVTKTGAGTKSVTVDGKKQVVKTIEARAAASDTYVKLTVLDDANWPLVLVNDEADECGWWLKGVGEDLDPDALLDAEDDEGEDDDGGDDDEGEGGGWRRFEMDEKFWAIKLDGDSHTVKFGKQGTDGQEKTKSFDDEAAAKKDYDRLVKEKTGKGYEEVEGD